MRQEDEIDRMIWEGSPVQPVADPKPRNSSFPESAGRTRGAESTVLSTVALAARKIAVFSIPTAYEIAATKSPEGQPEIDRVVLASVGSMDGRE